MEPDGNPIDARSLEKQTERLRALAHGLVRDYDRAQDVVQETCLQALTGSVRPRRSVAACLGGVVRNVARKLARGEHRRRTREGRAARPEALPSTADLVARLDVQRQVLARVQALEEPYRSTLLLRYFEDLSPAEIAARGGIPVETVRTRLRRGLARLREAMDARHGGSRRAWLSILLPVAGMVPAAAGAAAASVAAKGLVTSGGIVTQGTGWKTAAGVAALLVLAAGGLLAGGALEGDGPEAGNDTPARLTAEGAPPGLDGRGSDAATADARPLQHPTGGGEATAGVARARAARPDEGSALRASPLPAEPSAEELARTPPAVRRSPYGLPRREGTRIGGGGPSPTGHWTKYRPPPPRGGRARMAVAVTDAEGRPVPGAAVYLGHPDDARVDGISFGDLRQVGTTGLDGSVEVGGLPRGSASVFANYRNRLNGPRGLDGRHGRTLILADDTTVRTALVLPFSVGGLGRVAGHVVGPEGAPVRSASVSVGFQRVWTDGRGRFAFDGVPAGEVRLQASKTGMRPAQVSVTVADGDSAATTIRLEHAESGDARLEGRVEGPQGEPVAHADVYLMIVRDRGTNRHVRTDEDGRFVMEALPDRVRDEAVRVQASRPPQYASALRSFDEGLTEERLRLRLPMRYVAFELRVVDAGTGEPVRQLLASTQRVGSDRRPSSLVGRDGTLRAMVEPGRHVLRIDGLDHEDVEQALEVRPEADGVFRHEVRLTRTAPPSVQVALTVSVVEATTGAPIERVRIEVLEEPGGDALARFDGHRSDGVVRMPARSGSRALRVTAPGHEPYEAALLLSAEDPEPEVRVELHPR